MLGRREGERGRVGGVDCGDDGGVVLELEKVLVGGGTGLGERVGEEGVMRAEGEMVYYVGEVEFWESLSAVIGAMGRRMALTIVG